MAADDESQYDDQVDVGDLDGVDQVDQSDVTDPTGTSQGFPWEQVADMLSESTEQERERLQRELERVYNQIEQRREMHEEAISKIESRIKDHVRELDQHLNRPFAGNAERREELNEKIQDLYDDLASARTRFWNDVKELEREKRYLLRDLDEVEDADDDWLELL